MAILLGGRLIRYYLLLDPGGNWREQLWLDALVSGPEVALAVAKTPKPTLTTPLPLNSCSLDSLTLLPGVGPVLAGRIVDARRAGVVFRARQDLEQVKGIGPALSARLDTLVLYAQTASADSVANNSAKSR